MSKTPLLSVNNLKVHFPVPRFLRPALSLKAVDGISFDLYPGETLGIAGESGCGKSTLARAIIGLTPITAGEIFWKGQPVAAQGQDSRGKGSQKKQELRHLRQYIQMIFQDPLASLNPRMTIADIIAEPLRNYRKTLSRAEIQQQVRAMMDKVGLLPSLINRYPHEFSGGQCQRIGIARALILKPELVICDEPVSALDVSIQAQVINLLRDLQEEMGLSLIFIAHDLSVVKHISDRIMVMYLGNSMEMARSSNLYQNPRHPYTQALLSAIPIPDPQQQQDRTIQLLEGDLPSPVSPPSGCVFRTRCPVADANCADSRPVLTSEDNQHCVACLKA